MENKFDIFFLDWGSILFLFTFLRSRNASGAPKLSVSHFYRLGEPQRSTKFLRTSTHKCCKIAKVKTVSTERLGSVCDTHRSNYVCFLVLSECVEPLESVVWPTKKNVTDVMR